MASFSWFAACRSNPGSEDLLTAGEEDASEETSVCQRTHRAESLIEFCGRDGNLHFRDEEEEEEEALAPSTGVVAEATASTESDRNFPHFIFCFFSFLTLSIVSQ